MGRGGARMFGQQGIIRSYKNFLITVNYGSDTISVSQKTDNGLQLVGKPVYSGGNHPTSITIANDLVCVSNRGER